MRSYLAANGLSVVDSSDMSLVVSGTAASAQHAFGVGLRLYKGASGPTYQAPAGNVRLPRGIASVVQSVAGLDTSLKLHPHYQIAKHAQTAWTSEHAGCVPHDVPDTPCAAATTAQNAGGGYLPADLAGYYGHEADANHEGTGQTIGFVEFSNYRRGGRRTAFQQCFSAPAITGTLQPDNARRIRPDEQQRPGRGHPGHRGRDGRRPRRHLPGLQGRQQPRARARRCSTRCATDNVDVVSDSWGLCELLRAGQADD